MRDEGVIKFDCRFTEKKPVAASAIDDLINYRNRLFQENLIGVYPDGIGFGNISTKVAGTNKFVISTSQTGHIEVCDEQHFATVDNYSINENWVECSGPAKASSESLTHAMVYEVFPDAGAIIHVHNNKHWNALMWKVPTTAETVPYGTPLMAKEVQRLAKESNLPMVKLFVMAGHEDGILSFGRTMEEAYITLQLALRLQSQ